MSWEKFSPEIKPCWCGKGTITYIMEMDDWNRTRTSRTINCQECLEKYLSEEKEKTRKKELREKLNHKAKSLAVDRYLDAWLEKFEGLNKKQAWEILTDKSGYPSLGTFYKHTKEEGMPKYIKRQFEQDFEACLEKLGISDENIVKIINERDNI